MKQVFKWEHLGLGELSTTVPAVRLCVHGARSSGREKNTPDRGASKILLRRYSLLEGLCPVVSFHTQTREPGTHGVNEIESPKKASPGIGTTENHLHSRLSKRQVFEQRVLFQCTGLACMKS